MRKLFVIEDDENIRNLVKIALEGYGYEIHTFEEAESALQCLEVERPDLAIFDLMLPGMSGLEAIVKIREWESLKDMPILVLSAKDKEYDKVIGLDRGADDYLTKPFSVLELAARVRSLLRRTEPSPDAPKKGSVTFDFLSVDMAAREVFVRGDKIALTFKEYELLMYLIQNRTRVVGREELLDELWDYSVDIETRTLDIHIRTLRQKLGEDASKFIKTVRSVGYRFVV